MKGDIDPGLAEPLMGLTIAWIIQNRWIEARFSKNTICIQLTVFSQSPKHSTY